MTLHADEGVMVADGVQDLGELAAGRSRAQVVQVVAGFNVNVDPGGPTPLCPPPVGRQAGSPAGAIDRVDQYVAFAGFSSSVSTMTRSTSASVFFLATPDLGSSDRPSRPRARKRLRQVRTVSGAAFSRRDTSVIECPSAHSGTIRDRKAREPEPSTVDAPVPAAQPACIRHRQRRDQVTRPPGPGCPPVRCQWCRRCRASDRRTGPAASWSGRRCRGSARRGPARWPPL